MTAFATSPLADTARLYAEAAAQAVAETLWPTRCAICDEPGELLCERCRSELPFIDLWRACPICGAPWGHTQCTECNPVMLAATGRKAVAFSSLVSPFELAESTRRIAVVYKDGGEQRLAMEMARYMARYLSPERSGRGHVRPRLAQGPGTPRVRPRGAARAGGGARNRAARHPPALPSARPRPACAFPSRTHGEHGACRIRPAGRERTGKHPTHRRRMHDRRHTVRRVRRDTGSGRAQRALPHLRTGLMHGLNALA